MSTIPVCDPASIAVVAAPPDVVAVVELLESTVAMLTFPEVKVTTAPSTIGRLNVSVTQARPTVLPPSRISLSSRIKSRLLHELPAQVT